MVIASARTKLRNLNQGYPSKYVVFQVEIMLTSLIEM